jgi:hypothetical protein
MPQLWLLAHKQVSIAWDTRALPAETASYLTNGRSGWLVQTGPRPCIRTLYFRCSTRNKSDRLRVYPNT